MCFDLNFLVILNEFVLNHKKLSLLFNTAIRLICLALGFVFMFCITICVVTVMDRLQTSEELQDKTNFIDPLTSVDLLKGCSPDYLLL